MSIDLIGATIKAADDLFGPWGVLVCAGAPSAFAGCTLWWLRMRDQRFKERVNELSAEEQEAVRLERERQQLSSSQQQLFSNLTGEITRLSEALQRAHVNGERGWSWARRCEKRMHTLYHQLVNARQMVDGDRERAGLPKVIWPPLPNLPTEDGEESQ